MSTLISSCLMTLTCLGSLSVVYPQEPIVLPATKDNSIVLVDGEWNVNAGQAARLRIKGNQHLVILGFDAQPLQGRRVLRATLVCHAADHQIDGVTISTLATPWDEHASTALSAGLPSIRDWGYLGAKLPSVCGGNGHTLTTDVRSPLQEGRYEWEIPPAFVECLSLGVAHGLVIHQHDVDYSKNPTIFSREQSGKGPYLIVELDPETQPDPIPDSPTDLKISYDRSSEARLTLHSPAAGLAYEVIIDGHSLGRHNIPVLTPNGSQTIWLRDLPDELLLGGAKEVQVVAINRTGQRSLPATAKLTWPVVEPPTGPPKKSFNSVAQPSDLAVLPVLDKYDQAGLPVGTLPDDYRWNNSIFDGQTIQLRAAAGEVASFQLLLRGQQAIQVHLEWEPDPAGEKDPLQPPRIDWFQAKYVLSDGRWIPDPLLPLPRVLPLQEDVDAVVVADIYVPFDRAAGQYRGAIHVSDGRKIPLHLQVLPFTLPRTAAFHCEMNSYGLPDHVEQYYALQQVAYDHRVSCNILHYGHHTAAPGARKSNLDMLLPSGRRMDNRRYDQIAPGAQEAHWDDFIKAFDPVLSGSLFQDGHRGPISIPEFYLTFHESWPLNCRAYFNGDLDAYRAFSQQPVYSQTYVNIMRDFTRMAERQGWTATNFHVYFNNKGSLTEHTKAPWILDEPTSFWDYRALQFYGELTDQGRANATDVKVDYRVDISRPEFCRGQLAGRRDLWVVSTWAFQNYHRLVKDRTEQDGLRAWVYGTANHVHENNRTMQAWVLDAWLGGAVGVVPWQTVDKTGQALEEADQLGLFIFDQRDQAFAIRHSLRLKAFRDAEQLVAYLTELQRRRRWTMDQTKSFVNRYVRWTGSVAKTDEADAGTPDFAGVSSTDLDLLKLAISQALQE